MIKKNRKFALVACILLAVALFLPMTVTVGAISATDAEVVAKETVADIPQSPASRGRSAATYSLNTVQNKNVYAYSAVNVTLGGSSLGRVGRLINGEVYIPIRRFVEGSVSGARLVYSSSTRTMAVSGAGHNISVSDGAYALYANGRVFFSKTPSCILSDGRMYVPVSNLAPAFSLSYKVSGTSVSLSGTPRAVLSGDRYYDADAVFWLARIISAESRGEPLIGQIAVGSVVLNRVRSSQFPNTIWGVIFDRKWGVQFSPVIDGSIYNTPTASAILAAKICLEGFSVSRDALYFLRPSASSSSWIVNNRPFLFVIGNHYFFA